MTQKNYNIPIKEIFNKLGLTPTEAARLLSVNIRTIRRWFENPNEISVPAKQALLAWLHLHQIAMPWRPDDIDVLGDDPQISEHIKLYRHNSMNLDAILNKVKKRGGVAAPWRVDLKKNVAILGPLSIWFHLLKNGSFSPSSYTRTDCEPDLNRDKALIEDALVCISIALEQESPGKSEESNE